MKKILAGLSVLLCLAAEAGGVHLLVDAPAYAGQQVTLYRYMDLFTRRLEPLAKGMMDAQGQIRLDAEVEGTQKALLLVGGAGADLWLRAGNYHVQLSPPAPGQPRSLGKAAQADLLFIDLDPLDVNALVGDLNERLDAFLAEGLATDRSAAMGAIGQARSGGEAIAPDTTGAARSLYIAPTWEGSRVDTFGQKLERFYAGVQDPWFKADVEYGLAGLRLGPKANNRALYNRYLEGRPVLYDVPEYIRFFSTFFADHLRRFPFRSHADALLRQVKEGATDSLKALLATNDFLVDDRLNELVLITNLYAEHAHALLDRNGILRVLGEVRDRSAYPEHRRIAGNMIWDLTAMGKGSALPDGALLDQAGRTLALDSLLQGPTCLLVARPGNPYSDQELVAMNQLARDYAGVVRFLYVILGHTPAELAAWRKSAPPAGGVWAVPADQRALLDQWRISQAPMVLLLEGRTLSASPGPLPSQGLVSELHRTRVAAEREQKLNRERGVPAPKR